MNLLELLSLSNALPVQNARLLLLVCSYAHGGMLICSWRYAHMLMVVCSYAHGGMLICAWEHANSGAISTETVSTSKRSITLEGARCRC